MKGVSCSDKQIFQTAVSLQSASKIPFPHLNFNDLINSLHSDSVVFMRARYQVAKILFPHLNFNDLINSLHSDSIVFIRAQYQVAAFSESVCVLPAHHQSAKSQS